MLRNREPSRARDGGGRDGRTSVLLVGHGSARSTGASEPARRLALLFEREARYPEVRTAFWKEDPPLRGALERMDGGRIVVVPLFMAGGYYTREVVPRELGLDAAGGGAVSAREPCHRFVVGGRRIAYAAPVGAWPGIDELVTAAAGEAAPGTGVDRGSAALVLIGHGTPRSPTSADSTIAAAERVKARGEWARVARGFLDQDPRIDELLDSLHEPAAVLVPFFLADGWHTRETIPALLAAGIRRARRRGHTVTLTRAVGARAGLASLVQDIVDACGSEP